MFVLLSSVSCKEKPDTIEQLPNESNHGWTDEQVYDLVSRINDWIYCDIPFPGLEETDERDIGRLRNRSRGLHGPVAVILYPDRPTWPPSDEAKWQFFQHEIELSKTERLSSADVRVHEDSVFDKMNALYSKYNEQLKFALEVVHGNIHTNELTVEQHGMTEGIGDVDPEEFMNELLKDSEKLLDYDKTIGLGGLRFDLTNLYHYAPQREPQYLWGNKITIYPVTNNLYRVSIRTGGTSNFRFNVSKTDKAIVGYPPVYASTQVD